MVDCFGAARLGVAAGERRAWKTTFSRRGADGRAPHDVPTWRVGLETGDAALSPTRCCSSLLKGGCCPGPASVWANMQLRSAASGQGRSDSPVRSTTNRRVLLASRRGSDQDGEECSQDFQEFESDLVDVNRAVADILGRLRGRTRELTKTWVQLGSKTVQTPGKTRVWQHQKARRVNNIAFPA